MDVIGHEQGFWFLLRNGDNLFLNVNSGRGAVGFSIAFELSNEEKSEYNLRGTDYLNELATNVNNVQDTYLARSLCVEERNKMHKAIIRWQEEGQN